MELVSVNGVSIAKDVKTALDKFNVKIAQLQVGTQLTIKQNGGYMSKYDVVQELLNYVDQNLIQDKTKKDLVIKAKQSKEEFLKIASDTTQFDSLESILNGLDRNYYKAGGPNVMIKVQPDQNHKHISSGTLYGIPNTTTVDPRRTGKVVVFTEVGNDLYTKMLKEGPAYGFIWYGPKDHNVWMYIGDAAKSIIVI